MATFLNSPRLNKGALIELDLANPLERAILFQYNPDTLTHSINAQTVGTGELVTVDDNERKRF